MGIRFFFGNEIEALFNKFSDTMLAGDNIREDGDPFYSPLVIVPNINVLKWIQMSLANDKSICFNIELKFLENGIVKILSDLAGNDSRDFLFLGSSESRIEYQMMIMSVLFNDNGYLLFGQYLGNKDNPDYSSRLWQLSDKLTGYFREYEYQREEMIALWENGKISHAGLKMEHDQFKIFNGIFADNGLISKAEKINGRKITTLPRYSRDVFDKLKESDKSKTGKTVHVFGFSQISEFHYEILIKLSDYMDINIYQMSFLRKVCENHMAELSMDPNCHEMPKSRPHNELLNLWGKPSIENIKILCRLINGYKIRYDIKYEWLEANSGSDKASALGFIQRSISEDIQPARIKEPVNDGSIRIFGCPDIYREAETVYDSILSNMKSDPELKLTDIAVFVTDMRGYKNPLKAVFQNSGIDKPETDIDAKPLIPYNLTDSNADEESAFGKVLLKMLDLPKNNFTRKDVFDLLLNPLFLSANSLSRKTAAHWLNWMNDLNVVQGYDEKRYDLYSWQQGFKRLRYGRILAGEEGYESGPAEFAGVVPYANMENSNASLLNEFDETVETLLSKLKKLKDAVLSGREWAGEIANLVSTYLSVPEDNEREHNVMNDLLKNLGRLEAIDEICFSGGERVLSGDGTKDPANAAKKKLLTLSSIMEFIGTALTGIGCSTGHYLTDGVTISSLMPLRPIPFKIIYVMGLNENLFPGFADNSTLDLRNIKPLTGDIMLPDANKYLFLETIMSARKRIYLSYVSRDNQKDEERLPSSVVNQLKDHIENSIIGRQFEIIEMPLKGYSRKYLYEKNRKEYPDLFENHSYCYNLMLLKNINGLDLFQKTGIDAEYARMMRKFNITADRRDDRASISVSISELYGFIYNPVDALIRKNIGLYDEDDDKSLVEYEPFFSEYPIDRELIGDSLKHFLEKGDPEYDGVQEFFERRYDHMMLKSVVPAGDFAKVDKRKLYDKIDSRINDPSGGLRSFLKAMKEKHFFKKAFIGKNAGEYDMHLPPPKFKLGDREITLTGGLGHLWLDKPLDSPTNAAGGASALVITNADHTKCVMRYVIRHFLFYITALCSGENGYFERGKLKFDVYVSVRKNNGYDFEMLRFDFNREKASSYLKGLLSEYLFEKKYDMLPFPVISEMIKKYKFDPDRLSVYAITEEIENDALQEFPDYTGSDILDLITPQVPENVFEIIKRRYGLIFECKTGVEPSAGGMISPITGGKDGDA